jgi:hypothetical protein
MLRYHWKDKIGSKLLPRREAAGGFDFPASHRKIKKEFVLLL